MALQLLPELGELGEHQRLVAGRERLLQQLLQPLQLARAPTQAGGVGQQLAGWLQTCLSFSIVASTRPLRSMPSLCSTLASMSSTTAW